MILLVKRIPLWEENGSEIIYLYNGNSYYIIFLLYLYFLNILYFFKYSCSNIFHRCSLCTFYSMVKCCLPFQTALGPPTCLLKMYFRVRTGLEKCLNFSGVLKKCLIFNFALKMVIFPGKVLENDNFILENKTSGYFVVFYDSWPWIIVNKSYFNEKKVNKKQFPSTFLSDLWLDGELHWNSRFYQVTLYFFTVIHLERHWKCPWNLKKCPWKSPWKVLEFFVWQPVLTMYLKTAHLRGGMAPCRVIFHENVNFLFVVQKCQVIHAFHKTHKQNVFAVIEIHTSGNFIDNMVFGDQRVSTNNEDGEQHSVQYFGKFIQLTGKLST